MIADELASIFVSISFFALIFGIVYVHNRENMALIERGINPRMREPRRYASGPLYLKYALLLIGVGLGMLLARIIDVHLLPHQMLASGVLNEEIEHKNKLIYFAMIAMGGGAGLVVAYFIDRKAWLADKQQGIKN
ncbi:MAG: hypothetical protein EBZ77_12760 [Chitinophagia bacterium]|nr:hypothetical protein [Chitinophagia bacterium]